MSGIDRKVDVDVAYMKILKRMFWRIELLHDHVELSLIDLHMQWNRQVVAG